MNIDQMISSIVDNTKARRAQNGLCIYYLRSSDGKSCVYAARDEADKQAHIAKLERDGDNILA